MSSKDPCQKAMAISIAVSVLLMIVKSSAYFYTGSAAILSDALESVVHLVVTCVAAVCQSYARRPEDGDHLYGHGKISYFSCAAEGTLVFSAGLGMVYIALSALVQAPELENLDLGAGVMLFVVLTNFSLGKYLLATGKKERSVVVQANGRHVLSDMWTDAAVLLGVFFVFLTGFRLLDSLVALGIGCYVAYSGFALLRDAYEGLMERADPAVQGTMEKILQRAAERGDIQGYHQLRHRVVDHQLWVDVHLTFDGAMDLESVHARACVLEMELHTALPAYRVWITSHFEPESHDESHPEEHFEMSYRSNRI